MKTILTCLFIWLCLMLTLNLCAQQTLTKIDGWNAYVHLPSDYDQSPTKYYPVIIFLPGIGEVGNYGPNLLKYGPGYFIASGNKMEFTVNGQLIKPIVISLQPINAWPSPDLINTKIDSIIKRWRVDINKIHLTGLSMGGWAAEYYVDGVNSAYTKRIASIVAMSAPAPGNGINNMQLFAYAGGKWWGFEGTKDYRYMDSIYRTMNRALPGSARYTQYVGGHCCWNTWYDPDWIEKDGESIYTWMLKQSKDNVLAIREDTFHRPVDPVLSRLIVTIMPGPELAMLVQSPRLQNVTFNIYDLNGRRISSQYKLLFKGSNRALLVRPAPRGIYILNIVSAYENLSQKLSL